MAAIVVIATGLVLVAMTSFARVLRRRGTAGPAISVARPAADDS